MYRKLILFFVIVLFVNACKTSEDDKAQYHIQGTIANLPQNIKVYIQEFGYETNAVVDSTITKGGKFVFQTNLNPRKLYLVVLDTVVLPLIADSEDVEYVGSYESLNKGDFEILGSKATKSIFDFDCTMDSLGSVIANNHKRIDSVLNDASLSDRDRSAIYASHENSMEDLRNYVKNYADTVRYFQAAYYASTSLDPVRHKDFFKDFSQNLTKRFKRDPLLDSFKMILDEMIANIEASTLEKGSDAANFVAINPEGEQVELEDFKGRYVLLDFWASWCPPCRSENVSLAETYSKFKSDRFELISYSLDKNVKEWQQAIKEDHMVWTNVYDSKEWASEIVQLYKFDKIPTNFLIDPNGKIVAFDLYGKELIKVLSEILNNEKTFSYKK